MCAAGLKALTADDVGCDHPLSGLLDAYSELKFSSSCGDHSDPIANMFNARGCSEDEGIQAACDGMVFLQCWPHICRKLHAQKYHSLEGKEWVKRIVDALHGARTEEQFERMAKVGMALARCLRPVPRSEFTGGHRSVGEGDVATWFAEQYLEAPWNGWWIGSAWRRADADLLTADC